MKVAIVCGSPSSEFMAPYDDEEWEIWVLGNRLERHIDKRVTRVFEIHDNLQEHHDPVKYAQWLASHNLPMIVGENFPLKNGFEVYPYKAVEEMYGALYLTSSPAYMLAYALLRGATDIALYGVDLSVGDHEYFWQRPCVEAWIGFAKGRGVNVYIPEVSHVGKCAYVEGRDWNGNKKPEGVFTEEALLARGEQHKAQMEELRNSKRQLDLQIAMHDGANQAYTNLAKIARAVEAKIDVKSLNDVTVLR